MLKKDFFLLWCTNIFYNDLKFYSSLEFDTGRQCPPCPSLNKSLHIKQVYVKNNIFIENIIGHLSNECLIFSNHDARDGVNKKYINKKLEGRVKFMFDYNFHTTVNYHSKLSI